jgi:hypothetical protein
MKNNSSAAASGTFAILLAVLAVVIAQRDGSVSAFSIVLGGVSVCLLVLAIGIVVRTRRGRIK